MKRTESPWVKQLDKTFLFPSFTANAKTEVCIIGGGISGLLTAYFTLKQTQKSIVLLEGNKCFYGATGHNAGHVVSYFERPLHNIAKEFGVKMTVYAQKSMDKAFDVFENIIKEENLDIDYRRFDTYKAIFDEKELLRLLKEQAFKQIHGLKMPQFYVLEAMKECIPKQYVNSVVFCSKTELLKKGYTNNTSILGCVSANKGCINSALFCEKLLKILLKQYRQRLQIFEESAVEKIQLFEDNVKVQTKQAVLQAEKVVLCTNGYTNVEIQYASEKKRSFIQPMVGYMCGWFANLQKKANAVVYYCGAKGNDESYSEMYGDLESEDYVYMTTRPHKGKQLHTIGGIVNDYPEHDEYDANADIKEEKLKVLHTLNTEFNPDAPQNLSDYTFVWHGVMGITKNLIRLIGEDAKNARLLYNLGCNGVGIVPSTYGGTIIADILNEKKVQRSIFTPL